MLVERRGTIVSRKEIIDAVWPGITVAENNLTIQISSLRRVLDAGRGEVSCIQTVPGRGYRFVGSVTRVDDVAGQGIPVSGSEAVVPPPPRLSMVILPFVSLDDDPDEDRLGNAITDDLTTELARLPGARVIARRTADVLSGRPDDIRRLDGDLGVRYVIEGSVRRLSNVLRVNAKLVSTETNTHLWAGRFDEVAEDRTLGQEAIIGRLRSILSLQLLKAENARSMRERPDRPDAYDLLLRAWPAWGNTSGLDSLAEAAAFFEQSLQLDPLLVPAMCGLAYVLVDRYKVTRVTRLGGRKSARTSGRSARESSDDRAGQRTATLQSGVPAAGGGSLRGSMCCASARRRATPERISRAPRIGTEPNCERAGGTGIARARASHTPGPGLTHQSIHASMGRIRIVAIATR